MLSFNYILFHPILRIRKRKVNVLWLCGGYVIHVHCTTQTIRKLLLLSQTCNVNEMLKAQAKQHELVLLPKQYVTKKTILQYGTETEQTQNINVAQKS